MAEEEGDLGSATLVLSTQDDEYNLDIDQAQDRAKAMDRVFEETHAAIKSRFAERFEHAGVYLFSRQMLNAVGLGQLAQHAFAAIDITMTSVAGAFGIAAETLGPLLLSLGVGVTIFELYEKHSAKTSESLEQLAKKQTEALATTVQLKDAIEEYSKATGQLPSNLRDLTAATGALDMAQRKLLEHTLGEQMAAAQAAANAAKLRVDELKAEIPAMEAAIEAERHRGEVTDDTRLALEHARAELNRLNSVVITQGEAYQKAKADVQAFAAGFSGVEDQLKKTTEAHNKAGKAAKKQAAEEATAAREIMMADKQREAEDEATSKAIEAARENLVQRTKILADEQLQATASAHAKQAAAIMRFEDEQRRAINETYDRAVAKAQETGASIVELERQKDAALAQLQNTVAAKQRENFTVMQQEGIKAAQAIEGAFADAFARTLVEGKDFGEQMKQMFTQIAEMIISDLIRIAIQAEITKEAVAGIMIA